MYVTYKDKISCKESDTRRQCTPWSRYELLHSIIIKHPPKKPDFVKAKCYWLYDPDDGILREPVPSWLPTSLLDDNLRLYRLRTDAKFSFPFGKATSPAAVPVRPFLLEIAISTSLISSSNDDAVVYFPRPGFTVGGSIPLERGGLDFCWCVVGTWRQKHGAEGVRGFEKAGSMMPCTLKQDKIKHREKTC